MPDQHASGEAASAWVLRFASYIRAGGRVLDLACGWGRHARALSDLGFEVEAVDRDAQAIESLARTARVRARVVDLEGGPWPYPGACFDGVVVTNYLHRPLLPKLIDSLAAEGVLIYETFARGNERYGRPSNPQFLLERGELLRAAAGLHVLAYEDLYQEVPRPAMVQRIAALRSQKSEVRGQKS
jgi:SAM-dependent methyltransferase